MDRIKDKLDAYGLPDPALGPGQFADQALQILYDDLIARGSASLLEALHVGGLIEEVDMEDLQLAIAETTHADLQTVYSNLLAGSVNHLNAFVRQITSLGVVYEAQVMSQAEVDALVSDTRGNQGRQRRRGNR